MCGLLGWLALALALAGAQAPAAQAQGLCLGGLLCDPGAGGGGGGGGGDQAGAPACAAIGTADGNPANAPVAPDLGRRLLPLRDDGRVPMGFRDSSLINGDLSPEMVGRLHWRAGSTLMRVPVHWGAVERERGKLRLQAYDKLYCWAAENGVSIILTLWTTPRWATSPEAPCKPREVTCRVPPAATYYPDLRRFAETLAIRYPALAAIEAWNEPNYAGSWRKPDPARYTAVLREIYRGVKNGAPGMPVLGGALSNHPADLPDGTIERLRFLDAIYAAGAGAAMDAISMHPYPSYMFGDPKERFTPTVEGARAIAAAYDGPGVRRLWLTEIGGARRGKTTHGFNETDRAEVLKTAYQRANAMADVDAVVFYTLLDGAPYGWVQRRDFWGRYMPRPVYCAFARMFGREIDCSRAL